MAAPASDPLEPVPRVAGRVAIRRLSPADLPQFQAYRTDAEVGRYQGWSSMSAADAEAFLAEMATAALFEPDRWCQLAIADASTNLLVGDIGVCVHGGDEPTAEIGFTLSPGAQGRGLGTEAIRAALAMLFDSVQAACVIAITDTRNLPSVRLLERVGMRLKETVHTTFRGEPCAEHVFTLQREQHHA